MEAEQKMYREKDQADFDLERFIDMFDEALTSNDERVVNALRSLMMMTILTKSETARGVIQDRNVGPLRRLLEDMRHINQRLGKVEEEQRYITRGYAQTATAEKEAFWGKESYGRTMAGMVQTMQGLDVKTYEESMKNIAKQINSGSLLPKVKKEGE